MKLFLDEGTLHAKIYLCTFLIVIFRLRVSLHFHTLRQENMMEQVSYILLSHFFLKQKKTELNKFKLGLFISVIFVGKSIYLKIADIF